VPLPLYGLLDALLRLNCTRDGDDEIRCSPCNSFALPFSFAGGPMGMASECSIGMLPELWTSSIISGTALAMAGD
jgi:hypothetical protein